jgi:hypothetical protein
MEVAMLGERIGVNRVSAIAICVLCAYCTFALSPHVYPSAGTSLVFFGYLLSVAVLGAIAGIAAGIAGVMLLWARFRDRAASKITRSVFLVAISGLIWLAVVACSSKAMARGLPAGSNVRAFEAQSWQQPESQAFVSNDISLRQKMLGDVVRNILPGRSRTEIESALGPSLETPYFAGTGHDMIYVLGPERESFFAIDSEWLLIWLDASGRFSRYEIRTD